jgi:hypothetical protein
VRSLCWADLLLKVARELLICKLFMGVQEVRPDEVGTEPAGRLYIFLPRGESE